MESGSTISKWANCCRLCLLDDGIKLPIFAGEGIQRQVARKIQTCFPILIYAGDPLPSMICHKCLFKLDTVYDFRRTCLEAHISMKNQLFRMKHIPKVKKYLEDLERQALRERETRCPTRTEQSETVNKEKSETVNKDKTETVNKEKSETVNKVTEEGNSFQEVFLTDCSGEGFLPEQPADIRQNPVSTTPSSVSSVTKPLPAVGTSRAVPTEDSSTSATGCLSADQIKQEPPDEAEFEEQPSVPSKSSASSLTYTSNSSPNEHSSTRVVERPVSLSKTPYKQLQPSASVIKTSYKQQPAGIFPTKNPTNTVNRLQHFNPAQPLSNHPSESSLPPANTLYEQQNFYPSGSLVTETPFKTMYRPELSLQPAQSSAETLYRQQDSNQSQILNSLLTERFSPPMKSFYQQHFNSSRPTTSVQAENTVPPVYKQQLPAENSTNALLQQQHMKALPPHPTQNSPATKVYYAQQHLNLAQTSGSVVVDNSCHPTKAWFKQQYLNSSQFASENSAPPKTVSKEQHFNPMQASNTQPSQTGAQVWFKQHFTPMQASNIQTQIWFKQRFAPKQASNIQPSQTFAPPANVINRQQQQQQQHFTPMQASSIQPSESFAHSTKASNRQQQHLASMQASNIQPSESFAPPANVLNKQQQQHFTPMQASSIQPSESFPPSTKALNRQQHLAPMQASNIQPSENFASSTKALYEQQQQHLAPMQASNIQPSESFAPSTKALNKQQHHLAAMQASNILPSENFASPTKSLNSQHQQQHLAPMQASNIQPSAIFGPSTIALDTQQHLAPMQASNIEPSESFGPSTKDLNIQSCESFASPTKTLYKQQYSNIETSESCASPSEDSYKQHSTPEICASPAKAWYKQHGVSPWSCEYCNKYYKSRETLNKHKKYFCPNKSTCSKCGRAFSNAVELAVHQMSHLRVCVSLPEERLLACDVCGKRFASRSMFHMHKKSHEQQAEAEKQYQCPHCPRSYSKKFNFEVHKKTHIENSTLVEDEETKPEWKKKCSCKYCGHVCVDSTALWMHMVQQHSSEQAFRCKKCGKEFSQQQAYLRHKRTFCVKVKCSVCGKLYSSRKALQEHEWKKHGVERHVFQCRLCVQSFVTRSALLIHSRVHHVAKKDQSAPTLVPDLPTMVPDDAEGMPTLVPDHAEGMPTLVPDQAEGMPEPVAQQEQEQKQEEEREKEEARLPCKICLREFTSPEALERHVLVHATGKHVFYPCEVCGKKFVSLETYKSHAASHAVSQSFHCSKCNKIYFKEELLKSHSCESNGRPTCVMCGEEQLEGHVCMPRASLLPCSVCSSVFTSVKSRSNHMKMHRRQSQLQDEFKRYVIRLDNGLFQCNICGKLTSTQQGAAAHSRWHNTPQPVKQFNCPFCNRKYSTESALYSHIAAEHPDST